jgi:AAA domain
MALSSCIDNLRSIGFTASVVIDVKTIARTPAFGGDICSKLAKAAQERDASAALELLSKLKSIDLHSKDARRVKPPVVATVLCMADVVPERVTWLWRHRLPRGKLSIVEGHPGIGKSHLDLEITARVTRGQALPFGDVPEGPEVVMLMSAEDGVGDTIQPRLVAAGADLRRVFFAKCVEMNGDEPRGWILPRDIPALREEIVKIGATVLIIDPLSAYLGADTKSHNEHSMRRAITPLAALADELRITVIVVRHLVKAPSGDAISAGGGSIATIGVARACLVAARDPENEKQVILAVVKNNLAQPTCSLKYRIVSDDEDRSRIEWLGPSGLSANQLIAASRDSEERDAVHEAKDFLTSALASKPVTKTELVRSALAEKTSQRTLERAAKELGVLREREGFGGPVMWSLPKAHAAGENGRASTLKSLRDNAPAFTPAILARMEDEPYSPVPESDEEREFVTRISRTNAAARLAAKVKQIEARS